MCTGMLLCLHASSTHSEAFICIIPKPDLLQNHESLKNAHRFLLKTNVLDVPLSKVVAPQNPYADSAPVSQSELVHLAGTAWACSVPADLFCLLVSGGYWNCSEYSCW